MKSPQEGQSIGSGWDDGTEKGTGEVEGRIRALGSETATPDRCGRVWADEIPLLRDEELSFREGCCTVEQPAYPLTIGVG